MTHRVGEVAGLHLVLLLDDRGPWLAVRNLLRRRLDCELGILEQPGKSGRAHVEVVGALAARVDEGEIVRVIVSVAVLVHIVVLVVLLLHRLGHCEQLLPGDVRRCRRQVDTTHRADARVLGRGRRSSKAGRWRDGGRAHRRLLAVSNGHHGSGCRPGIVLPGFCSLGLPGLGGARRSGIRGLGSVRKVLCSRVGRVLVRRVLVGRVHALGVRGEGAHQRSACKEAVFLAWPRGGFPRSVHFVNPPPTEAVGRRPHRGRWGAAHKGGGWGSSTEGGFFAPWVRQACGSAPLGGWCLSGAIWVLQRNPEANPEASYQ